MVVVVVATASAEKRVVGRERDRIRKCVCSVNRLRDGKLQVGVDVFPMIGRHHHHNVLRCV